MPFDTSNDYSEFENVESGESGTVEGLLLLDGPASAFRYRKQIIVNLFIDLGFGIGFKDIKGRWKVRVRADASRNADGSYAGEILFEQEVEWTARVVILNLGVAVVSWQPLGDGGSGKQFTSIAGGEACALYDIADADAQVAYGNSGAWRFVDRTVRADETPVQKYDVEKGFSIFTSKGAATLGSYQFYAVYQSQDFLGDFSEGAILETVSDNWAVGTLDSESAYTFSYKAGVSGFEGVRDPRAGTTWTFYPDKDGLMCAPTLKRNAYPTQGDKAHAIKVMNGKISRFKPFREHGRVTVIVQSGKTIQAVVSSAHGETWDEPMNIIEGMDLLATCAAPGAGTHYLIGRATQDDVDTQAVKGDLLRVVATATREGTAIKWQLRDKDKIEGTLPAPGTTIGSLTLDGGAFTWIYRDKDKNIVLLRSTNECKTWAQWASD